MQFGFSISDTGMVITLEEWRDISSVAGFEVSSFGRFRNSRTKKILKGTIAHNGYVHIGLQINGKQAWKLGHRLVAQAFLEQPSADHKEVNHINKNRADNRLSNLAWETRSGNMLHALAHKKKTKLAILQKNIQKAG